MPRPKKPPLSLIERIKRIGESGIKDKVIPVTIEEDILSPLEERIKRILCLSEVTRKRQGRMLFFVMYDIESNKVRRLVVKYLIRLGCCRVQKSIFLAEQPIEVYERIKTELAEVQSAYDNDDSIIVLPITTDYLKMMKVIGKNVNVDIITHSTNTLFF